MKALTLTQPWLWIILHLGKRIENRTRNIGFHRGPLLLHASSKMTVADWQRARDFVAERLGEKTAQQIPERGSPDLFLGAIGASCNVATQRRPGEQWLSLWYEKYLPEQERRWYMTGHHAYLLNEIQQTQIVPCKGALGFWTVPDAVRAAVEGAATT
jgi:hypothetical protein